jgi:hypothetical protein
MLDSVMRLKTIFTNDFGGPVVQDCTRKMMVYTGAWPAGVKVRWRPTPFSRLIAG